MIKNFTSLPASFVAVSQNSESPLYTRAKLKVFYVGETADHRLFTKEFSDKLLQTIGYTPVVSKYDVEKEDFEGHASQQQIYGIVDPIVEPTFEEENGVIWAVCDVILYTERPDETGVIAQKIIGQPQSLELKHDTVQYKINRDEATGKFKNIEFTDGQFIGVSVLGKNQDPAFTGSTFFNAAEFNQRLQEIKEYCDTRGETMNVTIPTFVEQSWGEKQRFVSEALAEKHGEMNIWLIDMYDEFCIFYLFDEKESKVQMMKSTYVCNVIEGGCEVTLGEPVPVRVVYEEMSSIEPVIEVTTEEEQSIEPTTDPVPNEEVQEDLTDLTEISTISNDSDIMTSVEEPIVGNDEINTSVPVIEETKVENDESTTTNTTSLTDSEQEELAEYRRKDKLALVHSYSENIPEEELVVYINDIDKYTREALENALNGVFVRYFKKVKPTQQIGFAWAPEEKSPSLETADDKIAAEMRAKRTRGNK